ncbi:cytochrome P450 [Saccharopolyspora gregorii]|uniref:cytochrome P450 n=1 Tax=Saccharopolyspora gregorii TaxID=33914 RepID=UPI0021AC7AE0|nr:cytochrome P450 [Saccharopolyspora gregorii]
MSTTAEALPQLPFDRPNVLEIAPLYEVLRKQAPITRVRTPAGDPAWLITSFEEARAVFGDGRFGRSHPAPEQAAKISDAGVLNGPNGDYDTEQARHNRMRKLLTPAFSAKRMRLLTDHVQDLVRGCLDSMQAAHDANPGAPVDLHEHLSFPLPVLVICELLGVPFEDREYFAGLSDRMSRLGTGDAAQAARVELAEYMARLAEAKRHSPGEDVVTDLVRAQEADPDFDDGELSRLASGLLFAGHETTVTRIDLGVLLLLTDLDRRDEFAADPAGRVQQTVEEILRVADPSGLGLLRYAHEDVEVGGQLIARGDAVLIPTGAANRDESVYGEPEHFDPERKPNVHLTFGHGMHFCIGASLARTELKVVFTELFQRFPKLRLAVDVDDLDVRSDRVTGGVKALPITW